MAQVGFGGAASGTVKQTITAIVLRGHYRGEPLVSPGDILELSPRDFAEARAANLVDYAPAPVETPVETSTAKKK
jgi:hypothetical protein